MCQLFYFFKFVLSGDGLPQEVCGVCLQQLDLSVTFKRQVCRADLMLREHLASTEEVERCETPTITGDLLLEDERKGKPPEEGEKASEEGKEVKEDATEGENSKVDQQPSADESGGKEKEDDWAIAEPWPNLGDSEPVNGEICEPQLEEETSSSEKNIVKQEMDEDKRVETNIPITHIKLEGGGTLLFSLSEEEQDENTNSINDLELSCSEVEEGLEEFKCPHCPKVFLSKRAVGGHQREHPEHSKRRDRKRARDRDRLRERRSKEKQSRLTLLSNLQNNDDEEEGTSSPSDVKTDQSVEDSLGDDDSQTDELKNGPRRSSRSTLGKAPERHVVPHYSCTKCERMYNDEAALENHIKMQHGMTYKCNHCGKKFVLKDSLESHIKNFHLDVSTQNIKKQEQSSINNNQTSNHESKHDDRVRRSHRSRAKSEHPCDVCGKTFENRSHLFSHMRSHKSTVHLCEICGKTVSLNTYPAHKRSHLNAESNEVFPCDTCGKKFNSKVSLRTHRNSYHGILKFTCEVCGKQFTTMALMRHHQNTHSGKKDHACQVCGKAFSLKVTLKAHMRIHTGEMPYGCENCGRHFTWKTTYRNHLTTCKKVQNTQDRSEAHNSVHPVAPSEVGSEESKSNVSYASPPPPMNIVPPYMPPLPQELPLDYSEEAKYHAPIDYREESKYRFLPISIPDTKSFPHMLGLREDIKYPYQQPLNYSGVCRDVKSPM